MHLNLVALAHPFRIGNVAVFRINQSYPHSCLIQIGIYLSSIKVMN